MLFRIFLFLIGFGFTLIGSIYVISYLNLMTIGYNFFQYGQFISKQFECLIGIVGILIMLLTVYFPKGGEHEFYL